MHNFACNFGAPADTPLHRYGVLILGTAFIEIFEDYPFEPKRD